MATLTADEGNRRVCYANGRVQHYLMPEELLGKTKEYVDGLGRSTKYEYDDITGFMRSKTDALGRITFYNQRSDYGHPLEMTHPDGSKQMWTRDDLGLVLTHIDELERVTTYTRDTRHRVTRIVYPDGTKERFTYNQFGQVVTHVLRNGGIETNTYSNRGLLRSFTDPLGNMTRYTYDASDRLASIIDARGYETKREYNERGLLTKLINADNSVQRYTYDDFGNRTSTTNELANTWTMLFDEFKRIVTTLDPLHRVVKYSYDLPGGGCGCSHDHNTPSRMIFPSGKTIEITYDAEWQKTSETVGAGSADAATTYFEYDLIGNLVTTIDPRGKSWLYGYDVRDRRTSTTDPLGHKTETILDAVGNVKTQIRADSGTTKNVYDTMDRLIQATDTKGQVTKMKYDDEGNMVRLTDANNRNYNFEYDLLDRKTKMTYPGGSFEGYTYDGVGNLIRYTNQAHDVRIYTYDKRNREIRSNWSDNTPDIDRTYDVSSQLLALTSSVSKLLYTYNDANEMTSETQNIAGSSGAKKITYVYNKDGLRDEMIYPDGTAIGYDYTDRNQIKSIMADGSPLAAYLYDLNGNRINKALENGTQTLYSYDDANRCLSVDNRTTLASFARFEYGYDNVNKRTFVKRDGGKGDVYAYDETDQVTGVQYEVANPEGTPTNPLRMISNNWDATGNRTTVTDNGTAADYITNNRNQYTNAGGNPLKYNDNGALRTFKGWTYSYDAQDRLVKAEKKSFTMRFAYDARNRRVMQTENGKTTFFYYDEWNLTEETTNQGVQSAQYVHGAQIDELLTKISSTSDIVYYHHDALGSVINLTNISGNVVEKYFYEVFGIAYIKDGNESTLSRSAFGNRFLFAGRELVEEIKLYDYRNRMYSAELGRFIQLDPIRFESRDVNLYRYVRNNSINNRDPLGLSGEGLEQACKAACWVSAALLAKRCWCLKNPYAITACLAAVALWLQGCQAKCEGKKAWWDELGDALVGLVPNPPPSRPPDPWPPGTINPPFNPNDIRWPGGGM